MSADAPLFFLAHGDKDTLVPVAHARHFADQLRQTSAAPVVYAELKGGHHAFDLYHSLRFEAVIDAIEGIRRPRQITGEDTPALIWQRHLDRWQFRR